MSESKTPQNPDPLDESLDNGVDDIAPSSSSPMAGLAMLLALVAIGIASYGVYQSYEMQQAQLGIEPPVDPSEMRRTLSDMQLQIGQLQQHAEAETVDSSGALTATSEAQTKLISALESRLDESLSELRASIGTSSQDWLLAEVEYLIRVANQRVVMEQDASGAVALFESADKILRDAEGIAAFELRQRLAEDIANLRGVGRLDVDGMFVKIAALIKQADKLEQKRLAYIEVEAAPAAVSPSSGFSDRFLGLMVTAGHRLSTLVDYRREGEVIKPILPPEEEYYLRQNLVMKLQLAQLGLLRSDQAVYTASLSEAGVWISDYFDPADAVSISFALSLNELSEVEVERSLPDVSGSLHAVRKLMKRFHEQANRGSAE